MHFPISMAIPRADLRLRHQPTAPVAALASNAIQRRHVNSRSSRRNEFAGVCWLLELRAFSIAKCPQGTESKVDLNDVLSYNNL